MFAVYLAVLCAGGTRLALTEVERRPIARVKYPGACIGVFDYITVKAFKLPLQDKKSSGRALRPKRGQKGRNS